ASYAYGSKNCAVISTSGHIPAKCRIYRGHKLVVQGQRAQGVEPIWAYPPPERNPYQLEWDHLIEAIRHDKPYNEARRGAEASLVTAMGRMAAHTGRLITYEQALKHDHEFAPDVDKLTMDGPAPLRAGPDGKYPLPQPGNKTRREY